jgi:hypothetical protein
VLSVSEKAFLVTPPIIIAFLIAAVKLGERHHDRPFLACLALAMIAWLVGAWLHLGQDGRRNSSGLILLVVGMLFLTALVELLLLGSNR